MVPTSSHRKRLAEQGQFRAPCSIRRRHVQSVEKPKDEVVYEVRVPDVVVAYAAVSGEVAVDVVVVDDVVDNEVVVDEVVATVVQPNAVVVDPVSFVTDDT